MRTEGEGPMSLAEDRVMIAIPAWNEQHTVGEVVRSVKQILPAARVVVIDDGSHDATAARAARAGAEVLQLPFNVGVGGAMRTAFLYAEQEGMSAVVQVDADGQHDPSDIPELLDALQQDSIVIGARFAGRNSYTVRGPRMWAMRLLAFALSRITKAQLTDSTSGFRASDRRAVELFARHYPAEYLGDTVESLVIAARGGLSVGQVPVSMRPRQAGNPSQGPLKSALYLGRAVLALFVALTRRRPAPGTPDLDSDSG
jgi:glycosyltransferase involved in cell wall biosynthesis